jgi:membrane protein DedA with SNARE-associated domain
MNASIVSFVLEKIQNLPGGLVYSLVAILVFGEAALFIGFVLPGETAVIVAGVVASKGHVNIVLLCALVVISAILGDSAGYAFGQHFGHRLLEFRLLKNRREDFDRALEGLQRRAPMYVFVGRFTAFLRAVMPGLAGMSKMHYRRFLLANAAGALLWGVGFSLLGYFAGNALNRVEKYASWFGISLLVVVIGAVVAFHFVRKRRATLREVTRPDELP